MHIELLYTLLIVIVDSCFSPPHYCRLPEKFSNIHPGDCVVCFNKNDIFYISQQLDKLDIETAVIYGGLPPGVTGLLRVRNVQVHMYIVMYALHMYVYISFISLKCVVFYARLSAVCELFLLFPIVW